MISHFASDRRVPRQNVGVGLVALPLEEMLSELGKVPVGTGFQPSCYLTNV